MNETYKRKITAWERMLNISPYSVVAMVTRIKGRITEEMLRNAVDKVQQRHSLLEVRIEMDENQQYWFTSEGVIEIPIELLPREDNNTWIDVYDKACLQPFELDKEPLIRFYLIHSDDISDVMIFCHHVICDGISLAYLARDLMEHLGDQDKEIEILEDSLPVSRKTIPENQKLNGLVMKLLDRINRKWKAEEIVFDQEDYINLHEAYWKNLTHKSISVELSELETKQLIQNCKSNSVSVNSALTAAFMGAQKIVQGEKPFSSNVAVAVNLRNRLQPPEEEGMGFYASIVNLKFKYDTKKSIWENAEFFHKKVTKLYTDNNYFKNPLLFTKLEASLIESKPYKILGHLVKPEQSRYDKISEFSKRDDTIVSLLKRSKTETIENVNIGTAVTNLTRMNFPSTFGDLELDRLIVHPGAGFPLVTVNLVVGVVTCSGKMSLLLDFAEEQIDTKTVQRIKEVALQLLLNADSI